MATVLVTMMPFYAERGGVPRSLAVEFPFGQTMGHDAAQQLRVAQAALDVLISAETPGTIVHSSEPWPVPQKEAYKTWQPSEPSPIIAVMVPQLRAMLSKKA